jgi:hypothetical protein
MKWFGPLFVVLVMLGVCTSSYGYFLVYKMDGKLKGTEGSVDIKKDTTDFRGYLVMNIDTNTNELIDANLIFYGKDANHHNVYVLLNQSDSNGFLDASILYRDDRNFYELNGHTPFDFNIFIRGDVHSTDIGFSSKRKVASSLYGAITNESGMLLTVGQELSGTGNVSVPLYTLSTKSTNNPNNIFAPWTQDAVVNTLKDVLAEDHYKQVYVPPPD